MTQIQHGNGFVGKQQPGPDHAQAPGAADTRSGNLGLVTTLLFQPLPDAAALGFGQVVDE